MTTMTREEALTIVTSIVREHSRECREPKPCQDCELEAEAIAALSAQAEPLRVTREQLEAMVPTPYYYHHKMDEAATKIADSFNRCREMTLKNIADYFEAGAKVEVSDG